MVTLCRLCMSLKSDLVSGSFQEIASFLSSKGLLSFACASIPHSSPPTPKTKQPSARRDGDRQLYRHMHLDLHKHRNSRRLEMEAIDKNVGKKFQKSYFDVLGLCCSSEIPLIERILKSLEGVKDFSVIVPTKTVIVVHDSLLISQIQIVKALNQARLEANIRAYGVTNYKNKWPSPYAVICGALLLLSFLKYVFSPLQWLAIGAIAVGIIPILLKAVAAVRNLTLDTNILVLIAVSGSIALHDYWEAGTIVFLFTIAEWLESRASHKV